MEKSVGEEMEVDAGSRSMPVLTRTERSTEEVTAGAPCKKKMKIAEPEQEIEIENEMEEQSQYELDEEIEHNIFINSPPILDADIENRAGCLKKDHSGNFDLESMDPEKEFYLVDALLISENRNYYKHLVVNNSSTRENNFNFKWSIDPETDRQYVRFYSKLEECISDEVHSWEEHVLGCLAKDEEFFSKKRGYKAKALEIGKNPEFSKLTTCDIYACVLDLILEKSLIRERFERSKGLLFSLLDCNGEEEEICDTYRTREYNGRYLYLKELAVKNFRDWVNQPGIRHMTKEEKKTELAKYHEKRLREDCSTRNRYLRLKLELAESLGLIPRCPQRVTSLYGLRTWKKLLQMMVEIKLLHMLFHLLLMY